jgi:hypothetical protein
VVEIFGHDGLVRVDQFAVESVVGDHHGHLHEGAGTHLVANDEEFPETSILEHTRLVLHHQIRHLRFGESATEGMGGGGGRGGGFSGAEGNGKGRRGEGGLQCG